MWAHEPYHTSTAVVSHAPTFIEHGNMWQWCQHSILHKHCALSICYVVKILLASPATLQVFTFHNMPLMWLVWPTGHRISSFTRGSNTETSRCLLMAAMWHLLYLFPVITNMTSSSHVYIPAHISHLYHTREALVLNWLADAQWMIILLKHT